MAACPLRCVFYVFFGNAQLFNLVPDGSELFIRIGDLGDANRSQHDPPGFRRNVEVFSSREILDHVFGQRKLVLRGQFCEHGILPYFLNLRIPRRHACGRPVSSGPATPQTAGAMAGRTRPTCWQALLTFLAPRIPQRHGPVEHRRARFGIDAVGGEIAVPLELEAVFRLGVLQRRLEVSGDDFPELFRDRPRFPIRNGQRDIFNRCAPPYITHCL